MASETSSNLTAKISKRLACCFILGFILCQSVYSQGVYSNLKLAYNDLKKEVILLDGTDSLASVMLESIEAKYNHQKNRKNKTVYYPLAEYIKASQIHEVPIKLANSSSLHLQGVLNGDTTAKFDCSFSILESTIKMDLKTTQVYTNEFSFSFKMLNGRKVNLTPVEFPVPTYVTVKKKYIRITVRGQSPYFIFQFKSPQPTPY